MSFEKRTPIFLDLGYSSEALPKLKSYVDHLWSANEELNLVSRKMTFDELMDGHIIDCLLPLKLFPKNIQAVADFGSGGGLPAVVYAIQFPKIQFHLYEKSPKKQDFLKSCAQMVPNLNVHGEIPKSIGKIDLLMAKGFKPLDVILEFSREYYTNQGRYFLFKGRKEKIDEEINLAQKKFKDLKCELKVLKSPVLDVERHLVLLERACV